MEAGDENTFVTITDIDGNILVDNQLISLVEFGRTGTMADGDTDGNAHTVMIIDGSEYMFLDEVPYPTLLPVNPFSMVSNTNLLRITQLRTNRMISVL